MSEIQGIDMSSWLPSLSSTTGSDAASSSSSSASASSIDFASIIKAQLDTDGDGEISQSEMQTGGQKLKNTLAQLNGISSQMRAHNTNSSSSTDASSIINQLDSNGDSALDITEVKMTQADFDKIDINKDGKLTLDELTSAASKAQGGRNASSSLKASQAECSSILSQLQATCSVKQYETMTKSAAA
jgi:hypothetical protein